MELDYSNHSHSFWSLSAPTNESFWEFENVEESFNFERIDPEWWRDFMARHWAWAFYATAIYVPTIFGLKSYMKDRPAFDLKTPLIYWNWALGIFSIMGVYRTAPVLLKDMLYNKGFYNTVCVRDRLDHVMVFWWILFSVSKFVELGDTLFIVLRKRNLQFIQYYHHVITLIGVWITTPNAEPIAIHLMVMNYAVHAAMYPYFALKMAGVKVPQWIANIITTAQLAQMIAGFLLNVGTVALLVMGDSCFRAPVNIWCFFILYGSFIPLFGNLFASSVLKVRKGKEHKQE